MLKQIKLQAELKERKAELVALIAKRDGFTKRSEELSAALDEAQTDEDIKLVQENIDALEKEIGETNLDDSISKLEGEIDRINSELAELDQRAKNVPPAGGNSNHEERGDVRMNSAQIRELVKSGAYYERAEVKEFYEKFRNLRGATGAELTMPEIVVSRVLDIVGDYTTLYPLVDKIRAQGTVRILIDTDTTAADWIEQTGTLPTGDVGTITSVSFDGFKIGKVTFVDNSMLQDSIINLDDYVTKKVARAIGLGLDKGILKGTGSANKQPEGILTKIPESNKVTVTDPASYVDIVKPIALIDTGEDSIGEIVAVVKRKTYYNRLLQYSVQPTSTGDVVAKLPNLKNPDLLGLRVVFNNNMDEDKILYGDFSAYTLVERESISIDKSEHVKFAEDQTGFRGKGRFDGKPTKPEAFALVTLEFTPEG